MFAPLNSVLNNNVDRLNLLLQKSCVNNVDNIEDFARKMLQEQLIPHAVSCSREYTIIINQFLALFEFMTEQQQIEEQCLKFLEVLHNIGGEYPSEFIKKQLVNSVKTELNIDLHLDHYKRGSY